MGWRIGARVGDSARYEAGASLHGRFGDLDLEATRALGQDGLRAQAAFGLVWIDGGLHAARPVRDSFAVVDAGAPRVHVLRQNRPVGVTGADGRIVVTDLLPYQVNRIGLDVDDLPLGAAPRRDAVDVTPGPRGGVMVRFPIDTGAAGEVRVLGEDGAPLPPGAVLTADTKRYPVGSEGRIYISGVESRKALLRGGEQPCVALIDRGALAGGVAVVCRRSP